MPLALSLALAIAAKWLVRISLGDDSLRLPVFAISVGIPLGAILIVAARETNLAKRVRESKGRLCPRCGYDLSGQAEDAGICPECGSAYDKRRLQELWGCTLLLTWPPVPEWPHE